MNNELLDQLKSLVDSIHPLPHEDWTALASIWAEYSAARRQILTHAGSHEQYIYFVVEGVQHVYYESEKGRPSTIVFMYPPSFAGVLDALMLRTPSRYYFETLTPSRFLRAPAESFMALMENRQAIGQLALKGISNTFSGVLQRLVELQSFSAEERFRTLLKRSPHILNLVPHKYLANYIGIDPTNFSKLVNSIRI